MLLRNFYNILAGGTLYYTGDNSQFGDGYINIKNFNGGLEKLYLEYAKPQLANLNIDSSQSIANKSRPLFGTGTNAVTFNDYSLNNAVSLTISNIAHGSVQYSNGKYSKSISMLLSNNTANSYTISEVGLYTIANNNNCLVYREVLSTPFTIAAGESVTYTHNFEFTMPTIS